jgi:hypothetical protein
MALSVAERQRLGRHGSVKIYLRARSKVPKYFYNGYDLHKIARACNISIDEVRGQLRTLGYELKENRKGLKMWRISDDKMQSLRE